MPATICACLSRRREQSANGALIWLRPQLGRRRVFALPSGSGEAGAAAAESLADYPVAGLRRRRRRRSPVARRAGLSRDALAGVMTGLPGSAAANRLDFGRPTRADDEEEAPPPQPQTRTVWAQQQFADARRRQLTAGASLCGCCGSCGRREETRRRVEASVKMREFLRFAGAHEEEPPAAAKGAAKRLISFSRPPPKRRRPTGRPNQRR